MDHLDELMHRQQQLIDTYGWAVTTVFPDRRRPGRTVRVHGRPDRAWLPGSVFGTHHQELVVSAGLGLRTSLHRLSASAQLQELPLLRAGRRID